MIAQVIHKYGAAVIAKKMDESLQTVQNWTRRGVPLEKAVNFSQAVDYEITPHQLYPNNYPHPEDGLPASMRCKCESDAA